MSASGNDINGPVVEKLCAAYRAVVEEPPFAATDEALLRAAARAMRSGWIQPTVYATVALLVVVLGLAVFAITAPSGLPWAQRVARVGDIARYLMGSLQHATVPLPSTLVPYHVSSQSSQDVAKQPPAQPTALRSGCSSTGPCPSAAATAAGAGNPKVSDFLAEPLKAAQTAMKAAAAAQDPQVRVEEYQVEIQELQVAEAATGQKTPYDEYLINAMLATAYAGERKFDMAAPSLQAAAESPYATLAQRHAWLHAAVGIYYQEHRYAKVIQVGNEALQSGVTTPDLYATMELARRALGVHGTQPPAH